MCPPHSLVNSTQGQLLGMHPVPSAAPAVAVVGNTDDKGTGTLQAGGRTESTGKRLLSSQWDQRGPPYSEKPEFNSGDGQTGPPGATSTCWLGPQTQGPGCSPATTDLQEPQVHTKAPALGRKTGPEGHSAFKQQNTKLNARPQTELLFSGSHWGDAHILGVGCRRQSSRARPANAVKRPRVPHSRHRVLHEAAESSAAGARRSTRRGGCGMPEPARRGTPRTGGIEPPCLTNASGRAAVTGQRPRVGGQRSLARPATDSVGHRPADWPRKSRAATPSARLTNEEAVDKMSLVNSRSQCLASRTDRTVAWPLGTDRGLPLTPRLDSRPEPGGGGGAGLDSVRRGEMGLVPGEAPTHDSDGVFSNPARFPQVPSHLEAAHSARGGRR